MDQVDATIELALEEARRALTYQAGSVDELRSRTGLLLAAAAITSSFLGSAAANQGHLGGLGIAAVVAFVAAVGSCLYILWPHEWTFVTGPRKLLEDWADTERDQDVRRFLAECLEDHYDRNKEQTDRLMKWFQLAAVSVGAAVILGSLELTTSI
jgi:hypothetical protein